MKSRTTKNRHTAAATETDKATKSEIVLQLGLENAFRGLAAAMVADDEHLSKPPEFPNLKAFMATLDQAVPDGAGEPQLPVDPLSPQLENSATSYGQGLAVPLRGDALLAHLGVTECQIVKLTASMVHNYPGGNVLEWNAANVVLEIVAALVEDNVDPDAIRFITMHSEYSPYFDISGILRFPSVVMLEAVLADGTHIPLVLETAKSIQA